MKGTLSVPVQYNAILNEISLWTGGSRFLELFSPRSDSCINDGTFPETSMIFVYGGPSKQSSGTYIDNVGIYVCGGHFNNFPDKGCHVFK